MLAPRVIRVTDVQSDWLNNGVIAAGRAPWRRVMSRSGSEPLATHEMDLAYRRCAHRPYRRRGRRGSVPPRLPAPNPPWTSPPPALRAPPEFPRPVRPSAQFGSNPSPDGVFPGLRP